MAHRKLGGEPRLRVGMFEGRNSLIYLHRDGSKTVESQDGRTRVHNKKNKQNIKSRKRK